MMGILLFCVLSIVTLHGATQSPAPSATAQTAEIRGRVIDHASGQPLALATVRLSRVDDREALIARTDEGGRFRFTGLPPGRYNGWVELAPFRATHVSQALQVVSGQYRPIVLEADEVREFTVRLTRTHAIAVRIVDPWGEPLSGIRVRARAVDAMGPTAMSWRHSTDDGGRLRVFGLPPGRYIVCAEPDRFAQSAGADPKEPREGLLRTCYPSADSEGEAAAVRLEHSDVELEIRMRRGRTFTVSGRVLDASGAPAAGARVNLAKFQTGESSSAGIRISADGQFTVTDVHPGMYAIEASLGGPHQPEQRRTLEAAFVPITLGESDIEHMVVQLVKGIDVQGRVTLEDPAAALPPPPGSGLMIASRLAGDRLPGSGSWRSATMRSDRTFTLEGQFGSRVLDFANVPRGWYVKSVQYAGREIIDGATDFKESKDPGAMEVILSTRGASVTGRVVDQRGNPVPRARVLMFRGDDASPRMANANAGVASATGTFRVGPARAGDYRLVALPSTSRPLQLGEWDRVARLMEHAERITLGELEERTIELHVVTVR